MNDRYAQEAYRNAERLRQSAAQTAESNTQIQQELQNLRKWQETELSKLKANQLLQARSNKRWNITTFTIATLTLAATVILGILQLVR